MKNNFIDFENELSLTQLEDRLEMTAGGGSCERKCSGGDGGNGGNNGGNGGNAPDTTVKSAE